MRYPVGAFALALILTPGVAHAFPIAVGAAGIGLLGVMAFPVALLAAAAFWCYKRKGQGAIPLVAALALVSSGIFLLQDFAQDQSNKAALFTNADSSFLSPEIPFPFMEIGEQSASAQAVTPAEFMAGLEAGHFKALKISTYPSLFMSTGQLSADEIWRDKDVLIKAVNDLGGRVVLVDQYGGIAASIAVAALKRFGLNVGFLQGGTTALSKHGWGLVDRGIAIGGSTVPVPEYRSWIEAHPTAFVMGVTTDSEFVKDGWIFGNKTLSLADFVANYRELSLTLLGKQVFVVGFETNDTGATPIIVDLLVKAGVDVHYVMPNPDEILIKPAYFDTYHNDNQTVSVEDAERFVLNRPDVEFLDFSERPWPIGVDFLKERYHRLPMADVAKGGLEDFVATLDPTKIYIGLAFDRRTAYHSLLAGEYLARRGIPWLGRFTLAASLTEPFLTVEDLDTDEEKAAYSIRTAGGYAGRALLGHGLVLALLLGAILGGSVVLLRRNQPLRSTIQATLVVAISAAVIQSRSDYPQLETPYWVFQIACLAAFATACLFAIWRARPKINAFSQYSPVLPQKAALLNIADQRGYRVQPGFVVQRVDIPALHRAKLRGSSYIVRSAMVDEAKDHNSTAGIYPSFVCSSAAVPDRVAGVLDAFDLAGVEGAALVQPYCNAAWYGVIQLQSNDKCSLVICDIGTAEDVTSGEGAAQSFEFPLWDAKRAPKLVRNAALALQDLTKIGACVIEFALSRRGRLTILQVNIENTRACAEIRLRDAANKRVVEVVTAHADALSAAIVSALAPGHIVAYGQRRFAMVVSNWRSKLDYIEDLKSLGFKPRLVQIDHLLKWVDQYIRFALSQSACEVSIESVVAALRDVSQTLGRMNRIATYRLASGAKEDWLGSPRALVSSVLGMALKHGHLPTWQGIGVMPLVGYNATATEQSFVNEEWPSAVINAVTPTEWIKDVTSILISARLASLHPAIRALCIEGKERKLMHALETQLGDWEPFESGVSTAFVHHPQTIRQVCLGTTPARGVWRIPAAGITGELVTPNHGSRRGILMLDRCSMDYLPCLENAVAVIAARGSITSHLMQHASAKGLPVVIGASVPDGVQAGDKVSVSAKGVITYA
ncbi:hypothetical protein CX658_30810 [Pseudomonas amygdali pv. lachrymans]|nr:hypothetical protein CX658_30810 [Pseudomonas amygdali pv. lachrymans]